MLQTEYQKRREIFKKHMGKNDIAIIPSEREYIRCGDSHFPFRQNSDFYYLTGFNEPEAVAVIAPNRAEGEYILFCRPHDEAVEKWEGPRAGIEGAMQQFGAEQSFPIAELDKYIPQLLENRESVVSPLGMQKEFDEQLIDWVNKVKAKIRRGVNAPKKYLALSDITHEMRLFKSPAEIEVMQKAASISAKAHIKAMQACRPNMMEYELEAVLRHEFIRHGARYQAYPAIVGAGKNACVLHYTVNNSQINNGDLVLIDAGCEFDYYASDITRTFPANGRFSDAQKALYSVVLNAQLACINLIKPGVIWQQLQDVSIKKLTEGLVELGILQGQVDELIKQQKYQKFYMHMVSHWLGLDTHDAGSYQVDGQSRALQANMALTIEPGLYIPAGSEGVDQKWWDIGIRIEDDILVTESGHTVLSKDVPKTVEEIEALMNL